MGSWLGKLKFWRGSQASEGRPGPAGNVRLRDFLFLDVAWAESFLEQLSGGSLRRVETTVTQGSAAAVGASSPLLQFNIGGTRSSTIKETQTVYWTVYQRLEELLEQHHKIADLSGSPEGQPSRLTPNLLFRWKGTATLSPDWTNWSSMMAVARFAMSKLQELERLQEGAPAGSPIMPVLFIPGGQLVVLPKGSPDVVSSLFPEGIPDEPPSEVQGGIFRPKGINVKMTCELGGRRYELSGTAPLEHLSPERLDALTRGPAEWDVVVTGLINRVEGSAIDYTPIAVFVDL